MGRSTTSTYSVTLRERGAAPLIMSWRCNESGRPTDENLAEYVARLEASTKPGGVNYHPTVGEMVFHRAHIARQLTGEIVAEYTQPMFAVV